MAVTIGRPPARAAPAAVTADRATKSRRFKGMDGSNVNGRGVSRQTVTRVEVCTQNPPANTPGTFPAGELCKSRT
ncbi:hypothetical protein GCM10020229_33180 [Kitasatospora albolonga]